MVLVIQSQIVNLINELVRFMSNYSYIFYQKKNCSYIYTHTHILYIYNLYDRGQKYFEVIG